jgi:hypothetical protein
MPLGYVALIGVGAAIVAGLFWPLALRASQALWDLSNRQPGSGTAGAGEEEWHPVGAARH